MDTVVLAFDIERTGAKAEHETIAIGAAVVDKNFKRLDYLLLCGYTPRMFPEDGSPPEGFEPRCWNEFWVHHKDKLICFEDTQSRFTGFQRPQAQIQKHIISCFQDFRRKWEAKAEAEGFTLELCSDNNVFDGGFINQMIFEHLPEDYRIPYKASKVSFGAFWETHSMLRGILAISDPSFTSNWGYSKRIREIYEVPEEEDIDHDHMPHNDAYTIACDAQIVLGIRDGRVKKRIKLNE